MHLTFSLLVHNLFKNFWVSHDLLMALSWLVYELLITYSLFIFDLFMTWLRLPHDLITACPLICHDLFMTSPWIVHSLFMTSSKLVLNLFMTWSYSYRFHDSLVPHDLFTTCQWNCNFFTTHPRPFLNFFMSCSCLVHNLFTGWDETNFLGRDRDREIRLIKTYYETETKK